MYQDFYNIKTTSLMANKSYRITGILPKKGEAMKILKSFFMWMLLVLLPLAFISVPIAIASTGDNITAALSEDLVPLAPEFISYSTASDMAIYRILGDGTEYARITALSRYVCCSDMGSHLMINTAARAPTVEHDYGGLQFKTTMEKLI